MTRTFAIGDIHGCLTALETLVDFVSPGDDDTLITLGDYVDRGPDSKGVLDWLIDRYGQGHLIPLRGNHDLMFVNPDQESGMLDLWLLVGGAQTLLSYGSSEDRHVPDAHRGFLHSTCRKYYETDTHIFVHAALRPDRPLSQQSDDWLYWEKLRDPVPHCSGKTVICGHTAQKSGWPLNAEHTICIDTWVYGDGWLTCLDVDSRNFWQAKETGETRIGHLDSIPSE
jgi:serine/threonine protein phosphatase 1